MFFVFLGEHSFKSFSLEDLVKSFDNTINDCFHDEQKLIEYEEESKTPQEDLIASSKYNYFYLYFSFYLFIYLLVHGQN